MNQPLVTLNYVFEFPQITLSYPDKKTIYKILILEHQSNQIQIRYVNRGPKFEQCFALNQFGPTLLSGLLSTTKKTPPRYCSPHRRISLPLIAKKPMSTQTFLYDLETLCKKRIPTLRDIPVNFQLRWSETKQLSLRAVSQPNGKRLFAICKSIQCVCNQ